MGGVVFVPAPIAIPLILLIIALIPTLPVIWLGLIIYSVFRAKQRSGNIKDAFIPAAKLIGWSIAIPWGTGFVLWVMTLGQVILAFWFIFQGIVWLFTKILGLIRSLVAEKKLENVNRRPLAKVVRSSNQRQEIPYQYQPLKGGHEVRLLELQPGSFEDPIQGDIITANLKSRPNYDALSYTWADDNGDTTLSETIYFISSQTILQITNHCDAAIRRLRKRKGKRLMWIDAVCINQCDNNERSEQVSMMSEIYVTARHVIAYTGEGTLETDLLYDWLNDIDEEELQIPSAGLFGNLDVTKTKLVHTPAQVRDVLDKVNDWVNNIAINLERFWRICRA